MMALLKYCENCKEDNERMELGYNPHHGHCNKWQCNLLGLIDALIIIFILIPLTILILPILLFAMLIIAIKQFIFG